MAQKVLVIDDDQQSAFSAKSMLETEGYVVLTAHSASQGVATARKETPHLVIVRSVLPDYSGEEVIRYLRAETETASIPVLILITEDEFEGLLVGETNWSEGYVIKPVEHDDLLNAARSSIRDTSHAKPIISSGNGELDSKMGGGIPIGSLTLIEGTSGSGKSVLTQQVMWGSLNDGFSLSLFTSENTVGSLMRQMQSLDLDVLDFLLLGKLRVYPVEYARLKAKAPVALLHALKQERRRDVIMVDSLTSAMSYSNPEDALGFFEECKRLCSAGMTVFLVVHAKTIPSESLVRIRSLCDAHLQLRTEDDGRRVIKMLEVTKVRGGGSATGGIVSFDVEPGWGMRVIPVNKVKG